LLLGAPALGALALLPRGRRPAQLPVTVRLSPARCFEGEDVRLAVSVGVAAGAGAGVRLDEVTFTVSPADGVSVWPADGPATQTVLDATRACAAWTLRPDRWGRRESATVSVTCRAGMGAWQTSLLARPGMLDVFPRAPRVRPRLVPPELLRRIGEHAGRASGDGTEFAGIRPYVPGDPLRDVNRPVSIRRRQWHVNQRAASRAADLVVMIDVFDDIGPPGDSTLDLAVRGAAALVAAYLRISDRAGLVVLGGLLRWLAPAPGDRHFYRIAAIMLDARHHSYVSPDLNRIPRQALPPGALVVAFTPLLDPRALTALTDLRQRGFALAVVDTLRHEPPVAARASADALALRVWRLEQAALREGLAGIGVPVFGWAEGSELDAVLAPVRGPAPRGRR
ncbi:DUF58 domain-containing protein, partial [Trebonia sp.]|uniref:DUF58 domain-containing protein n=1 Tax=Trebonia sp. TaxID=2767075 RepID=UPI00262F793A